VLKRLTIDHVAGIVLAAFALGVLWECRNIPFGSLAEPGPGALPALLAVALFVCSLTVVAGGRAAEPMRSVSFGEWRHGGAILAMCVFAALAIERLGYRITVFAMLFVLVVLLEKKRLRAGLLFAAGFSLGTHFLFDQLLRVPLPRGPYGL
jgi:hypothetical protein